MVTQLLKFAKFHFILTKISNGNIKNKTKTKTNQQTKKPNK